MKFYAGIGSRQTPPEILERMTAIALELRAHGWTLRSGGAAGADTAFARGAGDDAVIYLPWNGFNDLWAGDAGKYWGGGEPDARCIVAGFDPRLERVAKAHHPVWGALSRGARALHTRNVAQIAGYPNGQPLSSFVICWTPGGLGHGGTGQAIRIATTLAVPVYDLANREFDMKRWTS